MIQIIFNETPKTSAIPWNIIIPVFCVALGSGIAYFSSWLAERRAEKKEREDFLKIKKLMPEIIKIVYEGLKKEPLEFKTRCQHKKSSKADPATGNYPIEPGYILNFGFTEKELSKEVGGEYRIKITKLAHIGYVKIGAYDELSHDFIKQIKKWGHLK